LANNLEDQEQAVTPAATTEGKPTEKPQETNGDAQADAENGETKTAEAVEGKAPQTRVEGKGPETRTERPASSRSRSHVDTRGNGRPAGSRAAAEPKPSPESKPAAENPEEAAAPPAATPAPPPSGPEPSATQPPTGAPQPVQQRQQANPPAAAQQPGPFPRRGRHSIGNTGAQGQRNGATTLVLVEL
jgi:hypothetical protein